MKSEHATTCNTAKGRERCAVAIEELAKRMGATVTRGSYWEHAPRRVSLEIAFGPYRCSMSFEGGSRVGAFLGHWHTETKTDAHYPVTFGADINGSVNTYHYGKATTCEGSFCTFLYSLEKGLESLAIEYPELLRLAA